MKFKTSFVLAAALAAALPAVSTAATAPEPAATISVKIADTRAALRDLWIGHVFWVRNVVEARFDNNDAAAAAAERQVVANAHAIAGAIEPFYSKAASDKLFTLLAGHWGAVKGYLEAAQAGNKAGEDTALKALLANANEIAEFLGGANPNLPVDVLKSLLTAHGSHHVQQIHEIQAKQFDAEAKTWAAMSHHMYMIADALADGIAKQFPDKFR